MVHLSPNIFLKANRNRLIHQKSAPGTPLSPKRINYPSPKTPSRTPSDESSTSGFLSVPKQRLRGSSFSGDLDFSSRKVSRGFVSQLDRILTILPEYILGKHFYLRQCFILTSSFSCFKIFRAKINLAIFCETLEIVLFSQNNVYLLRQFSITGKKVCKKIVCKSVSRLTTFLKLERLFVQIMDTFQIPPQVIHVGDSIHQRTVSTSSINSSRSR